MFKLFLGKSQHLILPSNRIQKYKFQSPVENIHCKDFYIHRITILRLMQINDFVTMRYVMELFPIRMERSASYRTIQN